MFTWKPLVLLPFITGQKDIDSPDNISQERSDDMGCQDGFEKKIPVYLLLLTRLPDPPRSANMNFKEKYGCNTDTE